MLLWASKALPSSRYIGHLCAFSAPARTNCKIYLEHAFGFIHKAVFVCGTESIKMTHPTIGILGAGQLGRMLALAGYPLGLRFRFLDPAPDAPAGHMAEHMQAGYEDAATLEQFSAGLDAVTYEFENVPVAAARFLAERVPVYPPPAALEAAQDRLVEKTFFQKLGVATPPFAPVDSQADLDAAIAQIGLPAVLKTRRLGYDGKGQIILREPADAATAWAALGGAPLILEGFVPFERELSILAARSRNGETAFFPLVENHHRDGILRLSLAPAPGVTPALQAAAEQIASRALAALDYVGVLAIELFQITSGIEDGESRIAAGYRSIISASLIPCWSTKWPRASTTPGIGRSRALRPASSSSIYGPCWACRWAQPQRAAIRRWST